MRLPISPHGSPSGAPRRIRNTLYWFGESSSAFSTCAGRLESMSEVRSKSRNNASSGEGACRDLFVGWSFAFMLDTSLVVITTIVKTHYVQCFQRLLRGPLLRQNTTPRPLLCLRTGFTRCQWSRSRDADATQTLQDSRPGGQRETHPAEGRDPIPWSCRNRRCAAVWYLRKKGGTFFVLSRLCFYICNSFI